MLVDTGESNRRAACKHKRRIGKRVPISHHPVFVPLFLAAEQIRKPWWLHRQPDVGSAVRQGFRGIVLAVIEENGASSADSIDTQSSLA